MNLKRKGVEVNKVLYHYLEDYAKELKSYESSRYNCIPLTDFFGDMCINQIKPKHIKDYLKQRNMKPNTMKRELEGLAVTDEDILLPHKWGGE